MPAPVFTFTEYVKYRLRAVGAHGLHSPFVYNLYNQVINKKDPEAERPLRRTRKAITGSMETISFTDPKTQQRNTRNIGQLARQVSSSHKFSCFLVRLINHQGYNNILETGTSLGINAIYLASSNAKHITTIEGSEELTAVARNNLQTHNSDRVNIVTGNVKDTFSNAIREVQPELVFLDADHRSKTIDFYLQAIKNTKADVKCIVIHDIYWSPDMKKAWLSVISDPVYNLTIDTFQAGLIFPDHPIEKQHFTIKF